MHRGRVGEIAGHCLLILLRAIERCEIREANGLCEWCQAFAHDLAEQACGAGDQKASQFRFPFTNRGTAQCRHASMSDEAFGRNDAATCSELAVTKSG